MLTLIQNGEVYAPEPLGQRSILLTDGKIGKVGSVDRKAVEALGVECEVIDAAGCIVAPGLIDPHIHLLGGSGESGFSTQTPEFFFEIVHVLSNGVFMVRDGRLVRDENFLEDSNREIHLVGRKDGKDDGEEGDDDG
jgi:imidazolonepropionase-like amidohydrolase